MKKSIIAIILLLTSVQLSAQMVKSTDFYTRLFKDGKVTEAKWSQTTVYSLIDSTRNTDEQLSEFDSSLVNDEMEVKYAVVHVYERANNGGTYEINGVRTSHRESTSQWVVGIRFKSNHKWIPVSNRKLIQKYLGLRDPKLAQHIRKYPNVDGTYTLATGAGITFTAFMVDGFLLFGWHPYFMPVYATGAVLIGVAAILYVNDRKSKSLNDVVTKYNHTNK